jgi:hypothetical protein
MGASATLSAPAVAVAPGEEAVIEIRVRNTGGVVDQLVLDVLGEAGSFAAVEPNLLNLFPGAEGTATIRFRPPRAAKTPAGAVAYAVRVWSKEDPEGSTVEEGRLDVGAFVDTNAELLPRTSRGRRQGRHELAVDNRGNQPLQASVSVVDPDELITARHETTLVVPPGSAVFQTIVIRPKRPFLRGQAKTIPFQVIVSGEGQPPVATDGAILQEQVLPKWLLPAALIALGALVAGFVLWQTLLNPRIQTAARQAAEEQTGEVAEQAAAAEEAATAAQQSAANAAEAAGGGADGAGGGGAGGAPGTPPAGGLGPGSAPAGSAPIDFRLTGEFDPSGSFETPGSAEFDVPDGQTLQITDIVFQNPGADTGRLQVRRADDVLFEIGLANFRDYDYHFVTPLEFTDDEAVAIAVQCDSGGTPGSACTPAASFTGFTEPAPAAA